MSLGIMTRVMEVDPSLFSEDELSCLDGSDNHVDVKKKQKQLRCNIYIFLFVIVN